MTHRVRKLSPSFDRFVDVALGTLDLNLDLDLDEVHPHLEATPAPAPAPAPAAKGGAGGPQPAAAGELCARAVIELPGGREAVVPLHAGDDPIAIARSFLRARHEVDAAILTTAAAERALAHALVDAVAELEAAR